MTQAKKANSYYYMPCKSIKVCGKNVTVFKGHKDVWYSNERQAKDSWLPEPLDNILAKIIG